MQRIGMELDVICGGTLISVGFDDCLPAGKCVRIDGQSRPCDVVRISRGRYSLILGDRAFDLSVRVEGEEWIVEGASGEFRLKLRDPRRTVGEQTVEEGRAGRQRIFAEMAGKVLRLLVKPGETVEYEQGLLVLEAMKMQNEIRAPKSGVIREIAVREGERVGTGDFLLTLE